MGFSLICTVPIAILANAGRVTITGILSEINPALAQGFFHSLEVDYLPDRAGDADRGSCSDQSGLRSEV